MRKTSYDGADSSSITSGIENETKKSAANFNKMKKSSIKRKVQHFSHDSDDGIEPLLQTDKEKVEIANRSAKYLINKSKTESLHEKDNKVTDGYDDKCSIPIHVSSTSNMITNNVKESSTSTSYICGVAPIHNHMNTNIFNVYNETTGSVTTKNPILVEIDTCKPGTYSPSPLIFTTAKIHSDSKIKLMEPVQVTPVPILSTIEGNIVKAGVMSNTETKAINLSKTSSDGMKILSGKPEINVLPTCKEKTFSPTVSHYISNAKNEPPTTNSVESANLQHKEDEPLKIIDSINKPKLGNNDTSTWKGQPITEVHTSENKILIPHKIKQSTEILQSACTSKTISEKCSSTDKSNERLYDIKDNKISEAPNDLKNQDNRKINLKSPDDQQSHSISKDNKIIINASGTKRLLRQKNALTETNNDPTNKILKSDTQSYVKKTEKNIITKSDKEAIPKIDNKNDLVAHGTIPIDTKIPFTSTSAAGQPKGISVTTVALTEIKPVPSTVSASTSKVKSITEQSLNPTLTGISKDVPKHLSKSPNVTPQTNVQGGKEPINSKLTAIATNVKSDILSSASSSSQPVKTDPLKKCPVTSDTSTLPSYIVSTSKTKIGLTLTSGTPAITSKPQTQKSLVSTTNAHVKSFATSVAKSPPSTSATNGTKQTNLPKETKSKSDTIKKDGRA